MKPMADRAAIPITRRIEGLPIIVVFVLLLGLFMTTAPQVFLAPFIYTTFLSTLPPLILLAIGLTFVIGAGEIDLVLPGDHRFRRLRLRRVCSRNTTSAGSRYWRDSARASMVGFFNGVLIAKIGIPSFITTLGTQFLWFGMATVLSGGKSYALRGADQTTVWNVDRWPAFGRRRRATLDLADPDAGALDGADRGRPLVHPESPPFR